MLDKSIERVRDPQAGARIPLSEALVTVIEPKRGWQLVNLRELWRYRELLFFLTWRDIKVRYKQTVLGATWAVIQPFATMVAFSLFLGRLVPANSSSVPYPLFVFAGLIAWGFFAYGINSASSSIIGNQNLVTKAYFPRLIIPISAVGTGFIDFVIAFVMLLLLMAFYGFMPGLGILFVPVIILLFIIAILGAGILLAALTVAYRDFRNAVPFMIQLWMFSTPTIYLPTGGAIGRHTQLVLALNPAQGLILNFRAAVLGGPIDGLSLAISGIVGMVLLIVGGLYFRHVERSFADVI
jgi:lipopolysaccharide transport system permease protein